jgi:DNA-binding response OmpR family regulator
MTPRPLKIVVVDDHENLARGFAQALANAGYSAHAAFTAEEGLRLVQLEGADGVILDIGMPFINGVGFLYRLRALPGHSGTPVMVITGGSVSEETGADLDELGAVIRFKPLSLIQLLGEARALFTARPDSNHEPDPPQTSLDRSGT